MVREPTTRLWLLRPIGIEDDGWPSKGSPWDRAGYWDCNHGFVIRADSEQQARRMAAGVPGDENRLSPSPWLMPEHSTAEVLTADGDIGMVMRDFHSS